MREAPFVVWGDGSDVKDFLYIDDFIDAVIRYIPVSEHHDIVNIASGLPVTIKEVIPLILSAAQYERAAVDYVLGMPSMIPRRLIDISRLQEKTGWRPKVGIKDGIERTVGWYSRTAPRGGA
jgi:GDP-L-fucose synthase